MNPAIKTSGIVNVSFGADVEVIEPVNLYDCTLGDRVFVGPFVEIQKNVEIGNDTRIQSHSFICELVKIGNNCFIGHGVVFINDTFSEAKNRDSDRSYWRPTKIGNHVNIGSNATILPVNICDHVIIGAGAVVTKDILESGTYAGNPAVRLL